MTCMTTKNWMIFAVIVLLGGLSLYLNKDWFARDHIQLMHRSRPARGAFRRPRSDNPLIDPLSFWFDRKVKLTALKVIPVCEIETNKYPQPIWSLVSDSNSLPIKNSRMECKFQGCRPFLRERKQIHWSLA